MDDLFIQAVTTVLGNFLLFGTIPLIWWGIFHRKEQSFTEFVGLTKPQLTKPVGVLIVFLIFYGLFMIYGEDLTFAFVDKERLAGIIAESGSTSKGEYAGLAMLAAGPAFIKTVLGNGFCEELFFRGFLVKRFKEKMSSWLAVFFVAALFAGMHNVLFILTGLPVGVAYHLGSFLFVTLGSALLGLANEKIFNGSIWPSIILHGFGNFIFAMLGAF
ncbi:membrane protease YdiL (CAAX protease family) [Enterococcus sp. PF1-24]|uniref:CPBP family intramembrane glutamic endopeptidase n=1 Tax=unclassified Enterococcus TaxID=2608891 RepID=UPI002476A037|nr:MULTISPECIES: CPBP family intramembrane glutamic endopeptidase [unclassified Enterococcus]MDH6364884.1 membrane protease YdiL (CAAX protease family) [Enterococcus sp. PFB1-1]MDH6401985.1 membrane protease YdiL (CAAX protease family) [Enterococcus sp. PF1-24]